MDPTTLSLVERIGIPAAILIAIGWFLWKVAIPMVVKKLEEDEQARIKREEEYRKSAEEYRSFQLEEIRSLREESKEDRAQLRKIIENNSKQTAELITALHSITEQIKTMDTDITQLYHVVGEKRSLLKK